MKGYIIADQQKSKFSNSSKLGKAAIRNEMKCGIPFLRATYSEDLCKIYRS